MRTSAANAPALPHNLSRVREKARRIRRRRTAAQAAAGVVILALAAAIPLLRSPAPTDISGWAGLPPIGLWLNRDTLPVTEGVPPGNHVPGSIGEISAQLRIRDGKPIITPIGRQPGLDEGSHSGPAPLPDGGLATIGFLPGKQPNGLHCQVVVVDADGDPVSSRPLPKTDTDQNRPMPMTDPAPRSSGGRIVNWPAAGGGPCSADVLDATTGHLLAKLRPAIAKCTDVYFALSPTSTRLAALVTYRDAKTWSQRVIVLDARTGKIQKEFPTPAPAKGTARSGLVTGLDWTSTKTLRYARGLRPAANQIKTDPVVLAFSL